MSAKAIREATGKEIINRHLAGGTAATSCRFASVDSDTKFSELVANNPWLKTEKLVVKPDQLIKRRGKLGLIAVNKDLEAVQKWISERMDKDQKVGSATGKLRNFIIEPFVPHTEAEEMYVCIYSHRHADTILFYHRGGVDIGDVDSKAVKLDVPVGEHTDEDAITKALLGEVPSAKRAMVAKFVYNLYKLYSDLYFTYLEINPLVVTDKEIYILDLAAKLDTAADFICRPQWGEIEYPPPFGRDAYPEEAYIADLDSKSGASLKLTILNKSGRIWTMVAGGGASVIYSDTICALGGASELANYGEYSGAPSEQQTYEYAKTILSLMTQEKHPQGKVLIIGGGIANFTNVAATFRGIITALVEFQGKLIEHKISIFVRRAGPNYQEGLRRMREVGQTLSIPLYVFGPETHMTAIVAMALGIRPIPQENNVETATANFALPTGEKQPNKQKLLSQSKEPAKPSVACSRNARGDSRSSPLFTNATKSIIWGMQNRAVQSMLDFDFVCRRNEPSVVAIIYPFTGDHKQKFYWGHKEILIPVYKQMKDAMTRHPDADVLVNFASLRSAYQSTIDTLEFPQIRTIAIIAEGIPENLTRKLIKQADQKNVTIIGPATVGGVKPGCFKIGNTGGMMDNILHSKLYRPGSVAYVSRSGGMSNELNNIISKATDGVYEGVAIGGDRYPGSTFIDHIMRYQEDENIKMIVLLGEVGGTEEYEVCRAIEAKQITKPLVGWCIGTCAGMFTSEVQFGHAGSCANSAKETASAKNEALAASGGHVPESFDLLGDVIQNVYEQLVKQGHIVPAPEVPPPTVPMDYNWARELGLIRKPASFMTSICDERGQELIYAGMPISDVLQKNVGIGGVISLLWFQRCLPPYCCKFFEMCLMVTADHGPAVSGAHNTIVCARAGKDLVSSLVSGLLTIGDRFGGALDGAAKTFSEAYDKGYPLALFYRKYVFSKDSNLQHLYFILTGFLLGYWNYGMDMFHCVFTIFFTYCTLLVLKGTMLCVAVTFIFNLSYLLIGYFYTSTDTYDINWTMPQCILVLRLIGISYDYYDGHQPLEKLSAANKKVALDKRPGLLEMFGHCFFPAAFLIGPQFPMKRYQEFVAGRYSKKDAPDCPPDSVDSAVKRFALGMVYLAIFQVLGLFVSDEYLLTDQYQSSNFFRKMLLLGIWGRFTLYRYISCWLITEGACILFGLTYNGENEHGEAQWNGLENIGISIFENTTEFNHYIQSFNVNTNHWVAQYVYKRLKFLGNRQFSQLTALLFLSVWHGLHSGYYVCFFFEFLVIYMERDIKSIVKSNATLSNFFGSPKMQLPLQILLRIYTFVFMGWCLLPFSLLQFDRYWIAFRNASYVGIALFGLWPVVYSPILRYALKREKRD